MSGSSPLPFQQEKHCACPGELLRFSCTSASIPAGYFLLLHKNPVMFSITHILNLWHKDIWVEWDTHSLSLYFALSIDLRIVLWLSNHVSFTLINFKLVVLSFNTLIYIYWSIQTLGMIVLEYGSTIEQSPLTLLYLHYLLCIISYSFGMKECLYSKYTRIQETIWALKWEELILKYMYCANPQLPINIGKETIPFSSLLSIEYLLLYHVQKIRT